MPVVLQAGQSLIIFHAINVYIRSSATYSMLMKNNFQQIRSDQTIVESVKDGSQQDFENLNDTYASPLLGVTSRITGAEKLAEDAL